MGLKMSVYRCLDSTQTLLVSLLLKCPALTAQPAGALGPATSRSTTRGALGAASAAASRPQMDLQTPPPALSS